MENGHHVDISHEEKDGLRAVNTGGSITIPPDLFERLYLAPQNRVKGDLRKKIGNPTPIAIVGFIISLGPLSCDLMGWRGAGGNGAAGIPFYIFFGGVLMFIGGLIELLIGNTFPAVVFLSFSSWWLAFGGELIPQFNAFGAYAPAGSSTLDGMQTKAYNASFAFIPLSMALLCTVFLICSLRTNVAFVFVFFCLVPGFSLIAGAYFAMAEDYVANAAYAARLLLGAGAFTFACTAAGWWIFLSLMVASVDMPFVIPLGDLSTRIRGAHDAV